MNQAELLNRAQASRLLHATFPEIAQRTWYMRVRADGIRGTYKGGFGFNIEKRRGSCDDHYTAADVIAKAKAWREKNGCP
ncbi:hypothetical protein ATN89_17075 [Comamonas thiooxydans]|uniref:hypothetical protein n=1 Tax=Comamonas thiooxydans TaxID=363952 RepID=UPI0007C544B6|nr:hypothetical protein [Comamonas thiooxydans]OAD82931.1 hypothetical protein ATN89_17075 [Comamonas thiooxydans]